MIMNILVTGNLGYVGEVLVNKLCKEDFVSKIIGFDNGYYREKIFSKTQKKCNKFVQIFGDIRKFPYEILENIDCIISLAAVSNDPIGEKFKKATNEINYDSNVKLAEHAKQYNISKFIFASSCSVYGDSNGKTVTEKSNCNPLTEYAKSKRNFEIELEKKADSNFNAICLRFATACGYSDRLRLDLVVNDFIYNAIKYKKINVLSNGKPNRPIINVNDMVSAFVWAAKSNLSDFKIINVGSNDMNYSIANLANEVGKEFSDIDISINREAIGDNRSYLVDFSLYKSLAKKYLPQYTIADTVKEFVEKSSEEKIRNRNFNKDDYIRLKSLEDLIRSKAINENLEWINDE